MLRQRIHSFYVSFVLIVFTLLCMLARPGTVSASPGFTVSAVQGNITNGKLNVSKGDKVSLVVKSGGSVVNAKSAKYKSSNKRVATVSRAGQIKAKKKGTAVITVKYNGSSCKIKVKVKTSNITIYNASTGFNLSLNRADMQPGKFQMKVKFKNKKKVSPSKVSFSTSNASVATVDKKGVVTLKADGVVTIKAKYKKKTGKCTIRVTKKNTSGNHSQASSVNSGFSGSSGSQSGGSGSQTVSPDSGSTGGSGGTSGSSSDSGSSGNSGSSGSGGSGSQSGGTSTEPSYVQETEQKYTYKLEIANKTAPYTGYECVLHVITDNPDLYDHGCAAGINLFVDGKSALRGEVSCGLKADFDDIKYVDGYNKVSDGFMYTVTFDEPGYHTITIKENYYKRNEYDYDVDTNAKITFNVLDASASEEKFYTKMLQQFKGADDRETLENLTVYFRNNFKYQSYYVDENGSITKKLNLLANYGPWWLTFKDITCYDATEIMINFANRLGYVARPFDTGMKDHRVCWVYFDASKVDVAGFNEEYMGAYDACPIGTNNNYNADTFTYLY